MLGQPRRSGRVARCWSLGRGGSSPPARPFLLPLLLPEATLTRCFPNTWASFSCKAWPSDGHLGFCFLVWCAARSQVEECKSDKTE